MKPAFLPWAVDRGGHHPGAWGRGGLHPPRQRRQRNPGAMSRLSRSAHSPGWAIFSWKTPMEPRLATGATDENSRRAIHRWYVAVGSATTRTPFPILRGCSCEIWVQCPVVDEAALFCGSWCVRLIASRSRCREDRKGKVQAIVILRPSRPSPGVHGTCGCPGAVVNIREKTCLSPHSKRFPWAGDSPGVFPGPAVSQGGIRARRRTWCTWMRMVRIPVSPI